MKQFRELTSVIGQMFFVVILITAYAGPAGCQEKNELKAELVVQTGHTDQARSVAFSPDGEYLVSSDQSATKLWKIATGQELRTLPGSRAIFSPDGNTLATSGTDLKLWNWRTGQELRTIQQVIGSMIAFSPKGDALASVNPLNNTIKLWDVKSGQALRVLAGHTGLIGSVVFSPDGKTLASASADKTIKLWNWKTGEQLRTIKAWISLGLFSNSLAFSPNGETIAAPIVAGNITLWDPATGQKLREFDNTSSIGSHSLAFCQGGKALVTLADDYRKSLLDMVQNRIYPTKPIDTRATADQRIYIKLIDVTTGQELRRIETGATIGPFHSFEFSPDEKAVAFVGTDRNPKLLDATTGRELRTLAAYAVQVTASGASADNSLLASGSTDGSIKLWDLQSGRQIQSFKEHDSPIKQVVFSGDNKVLASATEEVIKLWDIQTGKVLKSLQISDPATQRQVEALVPAFYQNAPLETIMGKFKLYPGANGQLNIYQENPLTLKVSLVSLNENDWAAITPEGLFDASPGARKLMHYVTGLEPIQLEQMKAAYYVPGLLQTIFKEEPLPKIELFSDADLFPLAEYQPPQPGQTSFTVKLTNRGGGIGPVQVLINKKECGGDPLPPNFDPNQPTATIQIDLGKCGLLVSGKQNVVEVVTRNAAGSLNSRGSARGVEIVGLSGGSSQGRSPQVYAIVAGVSNYTGDNLDLNYAAKDAEDFARALDLGASKLFGADKVHIRVLTSNGAKSNLKFSSSDTKIFTATKADFTNAFEEFKKATPNDIFIVYLSGHGISRNLNQNRSQTGGNTYLYLTQEATTTGWDVLSDKKTRDAMTISSDELAELMKRNKALKQVLILDTCAAGEATTSLLSQRNLPSDQIKAIERLQDRIGFFVLMGSAADKVAYEATQYGQGLLTYSLLQGMLGAKLREDKFADIDMLFNYAQDTVPSLAKNIGGIQRPIVITPERSGIFGESGSFDIGMFTPVEIGKINRPVSPKPFVLRPSLIQLNENYDKLALTPLLRQALREVGTSFAFVDADEMIDAVKLSGSYSIKDDDVTITFRLTRNNVPFGKTLTINGPLAQKKLVIDRVVVALQTEFSK